VGKHTIFVALALTFVWLILMESFSWQNIAIGLIMSLISMHFMGKFFDFDEINSVAFFKLIPYPFWLIYRMYYDAFFLIKMILTDSKWGFMTTNLSVKSEVLRILMADSITLTPGSVYMTRENDEITLLCIGSKKFEGYPASVNGLGSIQKMLSRAEIDETKNKVIVHDDEH